MIACCIAMQKSTADSRRLICCVSAAPQMCRVLLIMFGVTRQKGLCSRHLLYFRLTVLQASLRRLLIVCADCRLHYGTCDEGTTVSSLHIATLFIASAGGVACLLCALTSIGLQRFWALAGRFGAASALGLAQLYTAELLSSDVQHGALIATAQVPICSSHALHLHLNKLTLLCLVLEVEGAAVEKGEAGAGTGA